MATPALQFSSSALWSRLVGLWDRVSRLSQRAPKTLRLCQSLPLGERRFVAVVEFEKARFLVGGTSSSLVLLSRLTDSACEVEDERESHATQLAREKPAKNRGSERC